MHEKKRHVLKFDDGQVTPATASDEEDATYVVKNINDKYETSRCTHTHTHKYNNALLHLQRHLPPGAQGGARMVHSHKLGNFNFKI